MNCVHVVFSNTEKETSNLRPPDQRQEPLEAVRPGPEVPAGEERDEAAPFVFSYISVVFSHVT